MVIFSYVAGVTYENPDGSDRQEILEDCRSGEKLLLIREPNNEYDRNAIRVCRISREQIGYIPQMFSAEIAPLLDRGHPVKAQIIELTQTETIGCKIRIEFSEQPQSDVPPPIPSEYLAMQTWREKKPAKSRSLKGCLVLCVIIFFGSAVLAALIGGLLSP